jgi:hypothetical protein
MSDSDIQSYVKNLEEITKNIKDEIFRISWYMRGGVTADQLLYQYSTEDRAIMNSIIKDNIEATKKSGMSLV